MLRRFRLLLLGVLLAALLPATAGAQSRVAPPGNSAVDQYRESVPEPDGPRRSLSQREQSELRRLGADGRALAETIERQGGVSAAEATTTKRTERRSQTRDRDADRSTKGEAGVAASNSGADTPAADRGVAAVSTSAVGDQLPLGWMAAIAVVLAVAGIARWRRA